MVAVPAATGGPAFAQPAPFDLDDAKAVAALMPANGVPDARLVEIVFGGQVGSGEIEGTIAHPTHDKVVEVERRVIAALPASLAPYVRSANVSASLEVDDCATAIDSARKAAYADAKERAASVAALAGVTLGGLVLANENDATQGCGRTVPGQVYFNGDTLEATEIEVGVTLNATFAIRP